MKRIGAAFLALFLLVPSTGMTQEAAPLWSALAKGGHVALMRHALAPGIGDPEGFRIADCSTQRNLNDEGRAQARRTGDAFRRNKVGIAQVISSEWCRCVETAELLKLGQVQKFSALNSFFELRENQDKQMADLRSFLSALDPAGPSLVMVTHQVNISALTGEFPRSGEIIVLKLGGADGFTVAGSIPAL